MTCCVCHEEIITTRGAAFEIHGFEEIRKDGGTNHVLWRQRTGVIMCSSCVMSKKIGAPSAQMSLVD